MTYSRLKASAACVVFLCILGCSQQEPQRAAPAPPASPTPAAQRSPQSATRLVTADLEVAGRRREAARDAEGAAAKSERLAAAALATAIGSKESCDKVTKEGKLEAAREAAKAARQAAGAAAKAAEQCSQSASEAKAITATIPEGTSTDGRADSEVARLDGRTRGHADAADELARKASSHAAKARDAAEEAETIVQSAAAVDVAPKAVASALELVAQAQQNQQAAEKAAQEAGRALEASDAAAKASNGKGAALLAEAASKAVQAARAATAAANEAASNASKAIAGLENSPNDTSLGESLQAARKAAEDATAAAAAVQITVNELARSVDRATGSAARLTAVASPSPASQPFHRIVKESGNGPVPTPQPLPAVPAPLEGVVRPTTTAPTTVSVRGRWRQIEGGADADFLPGGYNTNVIVFRADDLIEVHRGFGAGGKVAMTWRMSYKWKDQDSLVLGEDTQTRPGEASLRGFSIDETTKASKSKNSLPVTLECVRSGTEKLKLGDKTYERVKE